jgi:hypothetical protein
MAVCPRRGARAEAAARVSVAPVTPASPERERIPRLSRRALVLGSAGVLVGAVGLAALGFTSQHAPQAAATHTATHGADQLTTLSLTEVRGHKPLGRP